MAEILEFRELRADEIDCRIATVQDNGLSILLYKDARCDMNILDETVGPMNWKREHTRENANCIVSIWDEGKRQWISKEDTGTESNTQKEKGLASDSFKRACFNWGIGRELYTAPYIWFNAGDANISNKKCSDKFVCEKVSYDNKKIVELVIRNTKTKKTFTFNAGKKTVFMSKKQLEEIRSESERTGVEMERVLLTVGRESEKDLTADDYTVLMDKFRALPDKAAEG